jgi:hypothetical protein
VDQLDDEELALPEAGATAEADEELELDASASFFLFRMAFRIAADWILLFAAALRKRCLRVWSDCRKESMFMDKQKKELHRISKIERARIPTPRISIENVRGGYWGEDGGGGRALPLNDKCWLKTFPN